MVANIPNSSSPTTDLASRLHRKVERPTEVELKTALALQDASTCGLLVVTSVDAIAETIQFSTGMIIRAIKRMRRLGLIAAEFAGIDDRIVCVVASTCAEERVNEFIADLIDRQAGGTAAA